MSEQEQPQHGPYEEEVEYVDPNSGAAPQPGGGVPRLSPQPQDEATAVSPEQADEAMSGEQEPDLESMTKAELTEMAEAQGVEVKSSMTKAELIQELQKAKSES